MRESLFFLQFVDKRLRSDGFDNKFWILELSGFGQSFNTSVGGSTRPCENWAAKQNLTNLVFIFLSSVTKENILRAAFSFTTYICVGSRIFATHIFYSMHLGLSFETLMTSRGLDLVNYDVRWSNNCIVNKQKMIWGEKKHWNPTCETNQLTLNMAYGLEATGGLYSNSNVIKLFGEQQLSGWCEDQSW